MLSARQASCSSEAAVALHSAAALAAKRSCEVEQLRAAHSRSEVDQRRASAKMDAAGSLVAASEQLNYVVREYAAAAASQPRRRQPRPLLPARHAPPRHALAPARAVDRTMGSELALLEARRMETAEQARPCYLFTAYTLLIHCTYTAYTLHIHCIYTAWRPGR